MPPHICLDFKQAISFVIEFLHWVICSDVGGFQPHPVSLGILFGWSPFSVVELFHLLCCQFQYMSCTFSYCFYFLGKVVCKSFFTNLLMLIPLLGCCP